MVYCLRVTIAAIAFDLVVDRPFEELSSGGLDPAFLGDASQHDTTAVVQGHYLSEPVIDLEDAELVFQSGTIWDVYRLDGATVFTVKHLDLPGTPVFRIGVFQPDFLRGDVYHPVAVQQYRVTPPAPLEHPISHLLMMTLLAQGHGVLIHACGIDDHGKGILFAGSSGHGKSTMAGLWQGEGTVLSDERVVLRQYEGQLWIFGTPWNGDYEGCARHGVPLEKVFFLQHGDENRLIRRSPIATAAELVSHCFLPVWDPKGMEFLLDFCGRVADTVPCYALDFRPDRSIIDFARSHP